MLAGHVASRQCKSRMVGTQKAKAGHAREPQLECTALIPLCKLRWFELLSRNVAEFSVQVVIWTCSPEKLVGLSVERASTSEHDSPKLIDKDRFPGGRRHSANVLPGFGIEAIDGAASVDVVGHQ